MPTTCRNCGAPDATLHDLLFRGDSDGEVYLCDGCHQALERGFVWPGDRPQSHLD